MSQPRSSFSLASLFLLMAGISVMMAATRSAVPRWQDKNVAIGWMAAGAVFGGLAGLAVGCTSRRWFVGSIGGFFVGAATGSMAGAQLAAPPDPVIVFIGIGILIGLSLVLRPKTEPTIVDNPKSASEVNPLEQVPTLPAPPTNPTR